MKCILSIVAGLVVARPLMADIPPATPPTEVVIMAGQSNATPAITDYYVYFAGIVGVRRIDAWEPGAAITAWVNEDAVGNFQRSPIYLQRIFDPGPAVALAEAASLSPTAADRVTFLWLHGETDVGTEVLTNAYERRLRALLGFFREDFRKVPCLTIVVGLVWYVNPEFVWYYRPQERRLYQMRDIQSRVAAECGAFVVDTSHMERRKDLDPTLTDAVHFSQPAGIRQVGEELWRTVKLRRDFRPELLAWKDGKLSMRVVHGKRYTLALSEDLISWTRTPSFLADYVGRPPLSEMHQPVDFSSRKMFFKLEEAPPDPLP